MEKGAGAEKWMDYYNIHPRPSPLSLQSPLPAPPVHYSPCPPVWLQYLVSQ